MSPFEQALSRWIKKYGRETHGPREYEEGSVSYEPLDPEAEGVPGQTYSEWTRDEPYVLVSWTDPHGERHHYVVNDFGEFIRQLSE